jgi:hypothetical protein
MADMDLIRERYVRLNGKHSAEKSYLRKVETDLGVSLPDSFLAAAAFFDGTGIRVLPLYAVARKPMANVLDETKRLRSTIGLPANFVVLGEPPESLLVLDCNSGKVFWCDATDARGLQNLSFVREPEVWADFGDFLAHLVSEEEEDRRRA